MRFAIAVFLLSLAVAIMPAARADAPTFHKDVESILQKNCQDCHRPGQVAPFSLLSYDQARKRGGDIVHVTGEKQMPPWPASTSFGGPFRDQRTLSEADLTTLRAWVEAGCPRGGRQGRPSGSRVRQRLASRSARPDPYDARAVRAWSRGG